MYRQVLLDPTQRNFQRILWKESLTAEVEEYILNTVTYGLAPSLFNAIRCLHQLAKDYQDEHLVISSIILRDFYVDDLLTGGENLEEVKSIKNIISKILESGCFELRKWKSNCSSLIKNEISSEFEHAIGEEVKALGLFWNPTADLLKYKLNKEGFSPRVTKRNILSIISQIYDPLGLIGPISVKAKIILQELWKLD